MHGTVGVDSTYIEEKVRKIAKALFITSNLATPAELAPPPSLAVGALPSDEGEVESAGASLAPSRLGLGLGLGGDNAGTGTPAGTATGAATGTGDATGIGEFTGTGAITGTGDLTGTGVAIGTGMGTTTGDTTGTGTGITGALGGESRAGGTMTVLTCTTEML